MITTVRDAEAAAAFWRRRAQNLERALRAVGIKGDPVEVDRHLADLQAARVAHQRALKELATIRREKPLRGPIRLLTAPATADRRVPILSTAEVRHHVHAHQLSGKHAGPRKFVWAPASEREAAEVMQTFGLSTSAGSRQRGFSIERLR